MVKLTRIVCHVRNNNILQFLKFNTSADQFLTYTIVCKFLMITFNQNFSTTNLFYETRLNNLIRKCNRINVKG